MFRNLVTQLQGADFYMISSLLIFVAFFVTVSLFALLTDKNHLQEMSKMPLEQ